MWSNGNLLNLIVRFGFSAWLLGLIARLNCLIAQLNCLAWFLYLITWIGGSAWLPSSMFCWWLIIWQFAVMQWFAVTDDASGSQLMMMRVVKIVRFVFILGQIEIKKRWKLVFYSIWWPYILATTASTWTNNEFYIFIFCFEIK